LVRLNELIKLGPVPHVRLNELIKLKEIETSLTEGVKVVSRKR